MRSMRVPYRQKRNLTTPFELCEARESLAVSKESTYETRREVRPTVAFAQVAVSQMSVSVAMSQKAVSGKELTPDLFKAL